MRKIIQKVLVYIKDQDLMIYFQFDQIFLKIIIIINQNHFNSMLKDLNQFQNFLILKQSF